MSSLRSATLLCLFLMLGCIGIATATATEPKTGSFGTSSIGLWPRWWWRTHPKIPSPPSPSPSPIDNVASPTHMAPPPADDVISPPHTAPTTSCIKVDGCVLDLITSVFKRRISLSTQYCQGLSTISDDCFYREYTHSKRVPFFLGKVKNYCSHAFDNAAPSPSPVDDTTLPTHAAPSPSPVDNVASPTHASPSPSLIDNVASPTHTIPPPSLVNDVVSPSHMAPSWGPAPTTSCIKVDGCAFNLITSIFKRRISLSTQCCQVLSTISDDCFYREFTHSKRVLFFLDFEACAVSKSIEKDNVNGNLYPNMIELQRSAYETWRRLELPSYGEGGYPMTLGVVGSDLSALCPNFSKEIILTRG
uniref:Prolamin-like domain-containing protein n=2 Tax=Solanum TaxID=4107 RepID=A4UV13_SOLTU|nr:hypothetical protein SDM1_34t00001 [Solanum demissum]ABO92973.1 hypothetical protein [Solanum tuberosum]